MLARCSARAAAGASKNPAQRYSRRRCLASCVASKTCSLLWDVAAGGGGARADDEEGAAAAAITRFEKLSKSVLADLGRRGLLTRVDTSDVNTPADSFAAVQARCQLLACKCNKGGATAVALAI